VSRANIFVAEGRVLQGVNMGLMRASHEPKLCGVSISMIRAELSETVGGIGPRA